MSPSTSVTIMKTAAALVVGFGFLSLLGAHPATAMPLEFLIDLIFWPVDGGESLSAPATRLVCAIGGGLMVGWGLMLWLVVTRLYPRDPELARTMILTSVGAWFLIDSAGSLAAGAPLNAVLNISFLLAFTLPLRAQSRPAAG
ncbi:MAG TPA: hypothetical protein VK862_13785 [Afifellaceae bacterium]|nr:hypothetical protein [Afifellaceae bacterium]